MSDSPFAALTAAAGMRPKQLQRRRRRALRRSFATGVMWTIAGLGMGWLLLAGIAGFAHA